VIDMLIITLDYLPHGNIENTRKIGEGVISNDGTGTELEGNYQVKFTAEHDSSFVGYYGQVEGFSRDRDVWQLVYEALKVVMENENGPRQRRSYDRQSVPVADSAPQGGRG
jgi:hypothetical protein